jgi:hypothetical protein
MAQSYLSAVPFAAPDPMPWNWNPAQTFLTAYYDQQQEKRAQQEFQAAQEMDQILFPIKQQQAQLALEKMNLEMERTRGEIDRQRILTRQMTDATRNTNRGFNSGLATGGSTAGGAAANAPGYQSQFGFGRGLAQPAQQSVVKPTWKVVTPTPTPTGP